MLLYQGRTGVLGHPVGPGWLEQLPPASNNIPKNVIILSLITHLSRLKTSPCSCATSIRLCKLAFTCMFFPSRTMNCNVGSNTNCSRAFLKDKIHLLLENILSNTGSKGKTSKSKPARRAVEGAGKVRRFFIKHYGPITMAGIQF